MKKTIRIKLSDIGKAIDELEALKKDIRRKEALLCEKIAQEIARKAQAGFNSAVLDDLLSDSYSKPDVNVTVKGNGNVRTVIASGEDAVWVEYGAGVYHNSPDPVPNRPAGIVGIGQYGKGHGKQETWGYFDENGELKLTHGTPAQMPMTNALLAVMNDYRRIVQEVFNA